jgi:hypothetical protein
MAILFAQLDDPDLRIGDALERIRSAYSSPPALDAFARKVLREAKRRRVEPPDCVAIAEELDASGIAPRGSYDDSTMEILEVALCRLRSPNISAVEALKFVRKMGGEAELIASGKGGKPTPIDRKRRK